MKMTGGRGKMFLSPLSRVRFLTKVPPRVSLSCEERTR